MVRVHAHREKCSGVSRGAVSRESQGSGWSGTTGDTLHGPTAHAFTAAEKLAKQVTVRSHGYPSFLHVFGARTQPASRVSCREQVPETLNSRPSPLTRPLSSARPTNAKRHVSHKPQEMLRARISFDSPPLETESRRVQQQLGVILAST
jgi:hypothetical protein